MRFAVCCSDTNELSRVCAMIRRCGEERSIGAETVEFRREDALWDEFVPGRFQGAVVGYGDVRGFLCARRLRESDSDCRVVLLDDTERYAIRGLRIHLSDFVLRPAEDRRLFTAIERLFSYALYFRKDIRKFFITVFSGI